MPRIALLVEYAGRRFCGSQYQADVRTVQGELESALSVLARRPISATFSGRTDSGVHAAGQVVHCDWPDEDPDLWRINWGLNGILNGDMSIARIQMVPDGFHARYDAIERRYVYRILNRPQRSALLSDTHYFVPWPLNLTDMAEAVAVLPGEHDFMAFKSSNSDLVTSVCRVSAAELLNLGEGVLEFRVAANHFVYNMVRIVVGTLIEIGLGKRQPDSLELALSGKDRKLAGPTAPSCGLCLDSIKYPDSYKLFVPSQLAICPELR